MQHARCMLCHPVHARGSLHARVVNAEPAERFGQAPLNGLHGEPELAGPGLIGRTQRSGPMPPVTHERCMAHTVYSMGLALGCTGSDQAKVSIRR